MQCCFASAAPPAVPRALGRSQTKGIEHLPSVEGRKIAPPAWHGHKGAAPEIVSRNWSSDRPPFPKSMLCRHPPLGSWGEIMQLVFHSAGGWVGACHRARAIKAQDLNIELGERGRHTDNKHEHNDAPKGNSSKWCNFSSIDGTLPTCNCQTKSLRRQDDTSQARQTNNATPLQALKLEGNPAFQHSSALAQQQLPRSCRSPSRWPLDT